MAKIAEYLKQILSARYGRDVRQSIHDAISAINDESTLCWATVEKVPETLAIAAVKDRVSGKDVTLPLSSDFILTDFKASGNTEQETTRGNQLLDLSTTNMWSCTYSSGVYKSSALGNYGMMTIGLNTHFKIESDVTYYIKAKARRISGDANINWIIFSESGSNENVSTAKISVPNLTSDYQEYVFSVTSKEVLEATKMSIQVGSSSVENVIEVRDVMVCLDKDMEYEPFTNGASPNPQCERPARKVILSEIKTCRKNINPNPIATTGSTGYLNNSTGTYGFVKANETYTISFDNITTLTKRIEVRLIKDGAKLETMIFINLIANSRVSGTFTPTQDGYIAFNMSADSAYLSADVFKNIQVEYGTTATEFEPYTESVETLSNPITLNGLNGVQDYADEKRGVEHHKLKEITLTSSMPWYSASDKYPVFFTRIYDRANKVAPSLFMSNKLSYKGNAQTEDLGYAASFHKSAGYHTYFYVQVPAEVVAIGDADAFKTWIDSNDIKLLYELAEPIETPLPEADVEALKNIRTFKGTTHIFTDSEVKPDLEVEYVIDTKLYIDAKFKELS